MQQVLIFDVDGTLTGPRRVMHDDFARFFRSIVKTYPVFLVTGSDLPKLEEQIPQWILKDVTGSFTCSGNELWQDGEVLFRRTHEFPTEMIQFLEELIAKSPYRERTGNHIEVRTGTLNASVVGRNATPKDRQDYREYDLSAHERVAMQEQVNARFPGYEANCGGQISIDISPAGWNKSQVFKELKNRYGDAEYHFFGDNIRPGGNDLPLAKAVEDDSPANKSHAVMDHYQTWKILQTEFCAS